MCVLIVCVCVVVVCVWGGGGARAAAVRWGRHRPSRARAAPTRLPPLLPRVPHQTGTDYGPHIADEASPLHTTTIVDCCTRRLVADWKHLRENVRAARGRGRDGSAGGRPGAPPCPPTHLKEIATECPLLGQQPPAPTPRAAAPPPLPFPPPSARN